ncbi:hypothetical protein B1813_14380 [Saccharomonospora piscinae]|uniref:Low molecular weight protein antigen 6 PH domain-containing protein n=2 Tax=Saccharomonospora piscinae TaxID=687388 RepID=A0A1V9A0Q0_SACPI|nr:PH domain-containing protein [Saccharomonospora piscinae]OQO90727.1 hypothetical protein B1813_14380 [Saccharomonospora piscinae]
MDNSGMTWAPKPGLVAVGWALTAAAGGSLIWFVSSGDRPGTVLLAVTTLALLAASLHGTALRPRLRADAGGVRLRGLGGTRSYTWSQLDVRLGRTRRYGRDVEALELDADDDRLHVLGWTELGTDPHEVHEALLRLRQRPPAS